MTDVSRSSRFMLGLVLILLGGVFSFIYSSMQASLSGTGQSIGMDLIPLFPYLCGIFLIVHALVVKTDGGVS
jgi:hypothetical protein